MSKVDVSSQTSAKRVAGLESSLQAQLPHYSTVLFTAKQDKQFTFAEIGDKIGRNEVAVASIFYGQSQASPEDIQNLVDVLDIEQAQAQNIATQMMLWPHRGRSTEMPPKEPLIYRLYEIVQNYGQAYKAVINEKFGDGIMSAISFSTKVEKDTDDKGEWVVITMRGKWLSFTRF